MATRRTRGRAVATRAARSTADFDRDATLANLREIYIKLDWADTHALTPAEQDKWFRQYTTTRHAIVRLEQSELADINARLGAEAGALAAAIQACEAALHGAQETAQIVASVGVALSAIEQLVLLLA